MNFPRSLRQTGYVLPGPRVGFAWSPTSDQKVVIRGGYGIFYHWDNSNQESLRGNPPFTSSARVSKTLLSNPADGTNLLFPASIQSFDSRYQYASVQQWSLDVQRQLPAQIVLSVAYVGNHAVHLDQEPNLNQPQPHIGVANGIVNVNTIRSYLGFGAITYDERNASADYNALQVSANRRFSSGLGVQLSYTWSKALAIGAGQNPFVQPNEVALASTNQPQNLTINWVYDLPFFRNYTGWSHATFYGWEWSGSAVFASGFPFTITESGDRGRGRKQRAPECRRNSLHHWFSGGVFQYGRLCPSAAGSIWKRRRERC